MIEVCKWCKPHWDKLRKEVKDAGLSSLVSLNGKELQRRIEAMRSTEITKENFDPLWFAQMNINYHAMNAKGSTILNCPLCELDEAHREGLSIENSNDWLKHSVNGALEFAQENNFFEDET